jgi:hypothetical protein
LFVRFGLGRWEDIIQLLGMRVSSNELKLIGNGILRYLLHCQNSSTTFPQLRLYSTTFPEPFSFGEDSPFDDDHFLQTLSSKSTQILNQIECLYFIGFSLPYYLSLPEDNGKKILLNSFRELNLNSSDLEILKSTWMNGIHFYDELYLEQKSEDNISFLPEKIEERLMKIADSFKTNPPSDSIIAHILPVPENWVDVDYQNFALHVFSFGSDVETISLNLSKTIDECQSQVENLIQMHQRVSRYDEIPFSVAYHIHRKIMSMDYLRSMLTQLNDNEMIDLLNTLSKWKNFPGNWRAENELELLKSLIENGLTKIQEIATLPPFDKFGLTYYLINEPSVIRRIYYIYEMWTNDHSSQVLPDSPSTKFISNTTQSLSQSLKRHAPKQKPKPVIERAPVEAPYPVKISATSSLLSIGTIVTDRPGFKNDKFVFPAGYKTLRTGPSLNTTVKTMNWISEIVDQGGDSPIFRVYQEDDPSVCFEGETPTKAWNELARAINRKKKQKDHFRPHSGAEQFLLTSKNVQIRIDKLLNKKPPPTPPKRNPAFMNLPIMNIRNIALLLLILSD